ncbi:MAG: dockerin type I domain-containing protein [Dehalococcoidia bacterium]|nr:dockerin type I domain-containing protein [Dehalococcoidia bacterium]
MCGLGDSKAFCTVDVLTPPPSPCDSYADVDGDGYVTYVDIGIISGFLEGTGSLTPEQKLRADINGDGAVTQADIDGIKAYLDGLSPTVPLCEDADNNGLPSYQEDDDNDGFVTWVELYLGTDPQDNCPDSSSDDAWPLDINKDRLITVVGDISNFSGRIGTKAGNPNYSQRLDFNTDGHITVVGDISLYRGHIPQSCS